jgi:hypothetical protein
MNVESDTTTRAFCHIGPSVVRQTVHRPRARHLFAGGKRQELASIDLPVDRRTIGRGSDGADSRLLSRHREGRAGHVRRRDDAVDLAHDVIVAALSARTDAWETPSRRAWIAGAMRRHAAFVARTEIQRRQRELRSAHPHTDPPPTFCWSDDFLDSLAPSVRRVAILLIAGMTRREATYVLGISDAAFRQRVAGLRRATRTAPSALTDDVSDVPDLAVGRLRQWLLDSVRRDPGLLLGTHDPDGHLLSIRRASRNRS